MPKPQFPNTGLAILWGYQTATYNIVDITAPYHDPQYFQF